MPPKLIGPYRVVETLGSGGVGTVFRALDKRTNETVALKLLSTGPALDPRAARRLAREFETLADLSHPHVVKVFDTGVFQGYPYLTMELVEGLTLRHYLSLSSDDVSSNRSFSHSSSGEALRRALLDPPSSSDGAGLADALGEDGAFGLADFATEPPSEEVSGYGQGPGSLLGFAKAMDEPDTEDSDSAQPLPFERATDTAVESPLAPIARPNLELLNREERVGRMKDSMLQLCEALSYIHARGLIHRDLKPSNVMVDEERMVRLMDFGLAKFLADDAAVTADGRLVGTFRYMAPEQILGEPLDARADLYSLGVILYELLVGRPPFDARTPYELWQKVLETEAPSILALNPDADLQLVRVAIRLMRKEPWERYQTAEEVFEALNE
ncbi:MAG: serine/threonine protein kinase [Myxococcota bacterium]|nr:serine/threonine protein kinase [Myxococcota bacterium]